MAQTQQDDARLAMACWDHTWLLELDPRAVDGGIERRLDETLERGFNALRLDLCPHLLATPANGVHQDDCTVRLPADPGQDISGGTVAVEIRQACKRLVLGARERGLRLRLTSSFAADTRARHAFVRRPQDFINVWTETLDLIRQWGALDAVMAVDFCHHFPLPPAAGGAAHRIFGPRLFARSRHPLPLRWTTARQRAVEGYLLAVPQALRALFPGIHMGLSASATTMVPLRQMDTRELDFIDLALWLDDDPRFRLASGADLPLPGALRRRFAAPWRQALLERTGAHWRHRLHMELERHLASLRARHLVPVLGDGSLGVNGGAPQLTDIGVALAEERVRQALSEDVRVVAPVSLARPHSPWLWRETSWLAEINRVIQADG